MRFTIPTITALSLAISTLAAGINTGINTTQEFYLRTELKTKGPGKAAYDGLYVEAYHNGAGLNDAVLIENEGYAIKGFANATNITNSHGGVFNYQEFDLGGGFPYGFSVSITSTSTYNAWIPVKINAGYGDANYFFNASGLQGGGATEFGGWLVCDWARGVPQLFQRLSSSRPSQYPAPRAAQMFCSSQSTSERSPALGGT